MKKNYILNYIVYMKCKNIIKLICFPRYSTFHQLTDSPLLVHDIELSRYGMLRSFKDEYTRQKQYRPISCYYQLLLLPLAKNIFLKFSGRNESLANFSSLVSPIIFTELSILMNVYCVTITVNIGRNNVALL